MIWPTLSLTKSLAPDAAYEKFTVESDQDYAEYSEEHDEYYCTEGWYEQIDNWDDYTSVAITNGVPTHWMPLPSPPGVSE